MIHHPGSFIFVTIFDLFCMIYVDDGEFVFESRDDTKTEFNLLSNNSYRFVLEMHIGTGDDSSKRECILFPHTGFSTPTLHRPLTSLTPPYYPRQRKLETEMHTWGRRIHYLQRSIDHKSERRIHHLHQTHQVLGVYISYSLWYNYNIITNLAAGNASTGAFNK